MTPEITLDDTELPGTERRGLELGLPAGRMPIVPAAVRLLFGIPVHAATMEQVRSICLQSIRRPQRIVIGVVNVAKVVNMRRMPLIADAVLQSDLVLADGMGIVWASRLLGRPLPERVAGIDLFEHLLDLADEHSFSVYLLGATQEIVEKLATRIAREYPKLRICGKRNGYFNDAEGEEVARAVRDARPDMLFVGMTSPKKEIFLARWSEFMDVPVCHGVGGSFDVLAGKVKRAPILWQDFGMEWLYRVMQEPKRMWKRYLVTNMIFCGLLIRELFRPAGLMNVLPESAVGRRGL
jgi:N-acetylglucosaminyldiphosphoundecaprenol N-acetyl-beta-D-mannosaminyltransferase